MLQIFVPEKGNCIGLGVDMKCRQLWRLSHQVHISGGISDNGPQYDCNEFETFAANWGFQHITSSPRYPQSNDFIERMIQTIKKTMKKAEESNADIDLALLCLGTTPIDSNLPPPAELLYSQKPRSNLPVLDHPTPQNDTVRKCLKARQQTQKEYYNKTVRDLSPLHSGQQILMQDKRGTWTPATVVQKRPEPRSYTICTPNSGLYRWNRRQLRDLPTKHITWADEKTDDVMSLPTIPHVSDNRRTSQQHC